MFSSTLLRFSYFQPTSQGTQLLTPGNNSGSNPGGLSYSMLPAVQTASIDGQEGIPTGCVGGPQRVKLGHNQALLTPNGQRLRPIMRAPSNQQQSMPFTLQHIGSSSQGIPVRTVGGMQQVLQLPMQQTDTIPVQVPVLTTNGQTVYQTLQLPVQVVFSALPGLMQGAGAPMQVISQLQVYI